MTIANSYQLTSERLDIYLEGEYLLSAVKDGYSPPGEAMRYQIEIVRKELSLRKKMFEELAKVYEFFASLALYDAGGEMENALKGLTASINDYSELAKMNAVSLHPDNDLVAGGGAYIVGNYQKIVVKNASEIIRKYLQTIKSLLEKQSERTAIIAAEREIARNRLKVAKTLWNEEIGLATEILDRQVSSYGLVLNRQLTAVQISKSLTPEMKKAVEAILELRHERELILRAEAYNASVNALQSLINAHRRFEKGEDFSLLTLRSFLRKVREYTDSAGKLK